MGFVPLPTGIQRGGLAMEKVLMVGADVHDRNTVTHFAVDQGAPATRSFRNNREGRARMIGFFQQWAAQTAAARVVLACEASACGFGLYDELKSAGLEAYVLAPSTLLRTPAERKRKADERDARRVLEVVRGAVLAGNAWPAVWVPDPQTRDDRELMRARLDVGQKAPAVKAQMQMLLKRNSVERPEEAGKAWTQDHRRWLAGLAEAGKPLGAGARHALQSLLRQLYALEEEQHQLDGAVAELAQQPRYAAQAEALRKGISGSRKRGGLLPNEVCGQATSAG